MKYLTALLAVTAALCVSAVAVTAASAEVPAPAADSPGQQDLRSPDRVSPAVAPRQDLRSPDRITAATPRQDLRAPDRTTYAGSLAPESVVVSGSTAASTDVAPTSEGGLSALWIVLISVGGALTLAGLAYATTRVRHAHGPAAS
jgi:hypothetical protein